MLIITTSKREQKGIQTNKLQNKPITNLLYGIICEIKTSKEISNKIKKKLFNTIITCMNIVFVRVFIYST